MHVLTGSVVRLVEVFTDAVNLTKWWDGLLKSWRDNTLWNWV
jgi:hypothetical protein